MDLPPSKLSGTASRLWSESAGQFHKKTDLKIDLGLQTKIQPSTGTAEDKASTSISRGYVFGSRVSERVTKANDDSETDDKQKTTKTNSTTSIEIKDMAKMDVSSIFKRMAEQSASNTNTTNMWKTTAPTTSISNGSSGPMGNLTKTTDSKLEESAKELAKKSGQMVPDSEVTEQQEIKTGEEDEHNLLHISCKFHQYNVDTKTWQERGMGSLKVNQHIDSRDDVRLVGRQSGSQRVLINSKIFPEMVLEELSEKRLKISAQTNDSELPQLFLIQASPASIANLQNILRKYIDACNMVKAAQHHLQIRKRRLEEAAEEREDDEDGEAEEERTEPAKKCIPREEKSEEKEEEGEGEEEEDEERE